MLAGILMFFLGLGGSVGVGIYIENDSRYTYPPPFTSHENFVLALLILSIAVALAGIVVILVSVVRKRNSDMLRRLESMGRGGIPVGQCPSCGLNVADNTAQCPRCGTKIKK